MNSQNVLKQRVRALALVALIGLAATGCRTYKSQNHVIEYWRQGNITNAVAEATKLADKKAKGKDAIVWRLEQGTVLRGAGRYQDSNAAFDQAQSRIDQYEQEAKVKIGNEAGALLSNQANLPYVGRAYDGIMLNTYKALNYMQLGELDKARVELIRAYQRQQSAVEENKKRIEKTQEAAAKAKDKKNINKAENDPKLKSKFQTTYASLDNLKAYADYVNPFTVYLDGLFFMADATDASDLERAHKSFERVAAYNPDNPFVKRDLAALDGLIQGKPLTPTTFVIFETGCAPIRDQIRIDIPTFIPQSPYAGAAFPKLELQGDYIHRLTVTADHPLIPAEIAAAAAQETAGTGSDPDTNTNTSAATATNETATTADGASATNDTATAKADPAAAAEATNAPAAEANSIVGCSSLTTSPLSSMDSVIGLDFKNELPVVITKTIASTVAKAAAAYAANQAASQTDASVQLIVLISTIFYQAAVNIADTRTWTTLPKEFQVCSFPTPADRKIVLEPSSTGPKIPVTIEDGTINIVYVKSITAKSPLLVTQFKLK